MFETAPKGTVAISSALVEELRQVNLNEKDGLHIGGSATFGDVVDVLEAHSSSLSKYSAFSAMRTSFRKLGSTQVRNGGTLAGNIVLNDYHSDLLPLLIACNAKIHIASHSGKRQVEVSKFFLGAGARSVDLKEGEVITSISIPPSSAHEYVVSYKMSKRATTSRSVVGATCRVRLDGEQVADISLVFTSVGPVVKRAEGTEKALLGAKWEPALLDKAFEHLAADLHEDIDKLGKHVEYRKSLVQAIFFQFLHSSIAASNNAEDTFFDNHVPVVPTATQTWEEAPVKEKKVVGHSHAHNNAPVHVTGEAKYVADIEEPLGTLHAALVCSTQAHAKIKGIDASAALKADGVVAFFSGKDFHMNPPSHLTHLPLLAQEQTIYYGEPLGIVVADTHENALRAAYQVKVEYEPLPAILDLDSAIKEEKLIEKPPMPLIDSLDNGNVDGELSNVKENDVMEGQFELGGHFKKKLMFPTFGN